MLVVFAFHLYCLCFLLVVIDSLTVLAMCHWPDCVVVCCLLLLGVCCCWLLFVVGCLLVVVVVDCCLLFVVGVRNSYNNNGVCCLLLVTITITTTIVIMVVFGTKTNNLTNCWLTNHQQSNKRETVSFGGILAEECENRVYKLPVLGQSDTYH